MAKLTEGQALLQVVERGVGKRLYLQYKALPLGSRKRKALWEQILGLRDSFMASQAVREGDEPAVEKIDPVLKAIQRDHPDARTVGDLAWVGIEKLGVAERRRDLSLTREQGVAKALQTTEGAALYVWTRPPWRDLSLSEALAKAETRRWLDAQGYVNWSAAVAEAAAVLSPDDPAAGLSEVEKRYPAMYGEYLRERRR
jgi:hypothetical protein